MNSTRVHFVARLARCALFIMAASACSAAVNAEVVAASGASPRASAEPATENDAVALEKAARQARDTKRFAAAAKLFAQAYALAPCHWQALAGAAMSQAEAGDTAAANRSADQVLEQHGNATDALLATAYVRRLSGRHLSAAALYVAVLDADPGNREAKEGLSVELEATRVNGRAALLARPADADALARLRTDAAAESIRWVDTVANDEDRAAAARATLREVDANLARLPATNTDLRRRARIDRLLALRAAERTNAVLAEAQALHREGVDLPDYVKAALAEAYLARHQPREAIALYRNLLEREPDSLGLGIALMYAYLDADDYDHASAALDAATARLPAAGAAHDRGQLARVILLAFGDQLAQAQTLLESLVANAPQRADLHRELAMVYMRRGWPQRALAEYRRARELGDATLATRLGELGARRSVRRYAAIETELRALENSFPDSGAVKRTREEWDGERGWRFDIEDHAGRGTSAVFGNRDNTATATLASPLIADAWRVFAQTSAATARVPEGTVAYRRAGLGLRYTQNAIDARIALLPSSDSYASRSAIETSLRWQIDERWWGAFESSTASPDVPLRARWYGITGSGVVAAAGWQRDDEFTASLRAARLHFSDGNDRNSVDFQLTQRLYTLPAFRLDATFELAASRNSRENAPYYNPGRDTAAIGGLKADWLTWRNGTLRLCQRFGIDVGGYQEESYGSSALARLWYEHDWTLSRTSSLVYGLRWNRQAYDGRQESRTEFYAALHWSGIP
ncbi:MAG: poly-beta-1,6 N-acetyl-D-glucosamine export porin PgaA [Rudaea sp.]|uniref:poly-beta-1,6 N-acetyl-D-glucosamine export porin PgaA n=1 Tax=Rudaea sp. TaxID=2136325 RepID=UPI0039E5C55D